jgi:hypothetical protein
MSKMTALVIAGVITSVVIVLVLGLAGGRSWFNQSTSVASSEEPVTGASSVECADPAEVTILQAQLTEYQAALQQANTQLQDAYDEIARLQTQGRFADEHEENEHEGGFFNLFEDD